MTRARSGPCLGAGPAKVPHPGRRILIAGEPIEGIRARPLFTAADHHDPHRSDFFVVCAPRPLQGAAQCRSTDRCPAMTPGPLHPALFETPFQTFPGVPAGTVAAAKIMPPTLPETFSRLAATHLVSRPQGQHSDLTGLRFDVSFLAMCTIPSVSADLSSCVRSREGGPCHKELDNWNTTSHVY